MLDMPSNPSDGTPRPEVRGEGQLLQSMVAHWAHEDGLYWAQIRNLMVLQLAVLTAWFTLGGSYLAVTIASLGAVISWVTYRLAKQIAINRNANVKSIVLLAENLASVEKTAARIAGTRPEKNLSGGLFRFASHDLNTSRDAGLRFKRWVFSLAIGVDLALAVITVVALLTCAPVLEWLHPKLDTVKARCSEI